MLLFICSVSLYAQQTNAADLLINQEDIAIEPGIGGFHLFVRQSPSIKSIALVEATQDPSLKEPHYLYRATRWNAINGNEKRRINGSLTTGGSEAWAIVDSTIEPHPMLGDSFHLFIPSVVRYGLENTRHGELTVTDGTFFNIRTFAQPYADGSAGWRDNAFVLRVSPKIYVGPPEGNYSTETIEAFTSIAAVSGGSLFWALNASNALTKIRTILEREQGKTVDVVICMDTTRSMKEEIAVIQLSLVPMLESIHDMFSDLRIGITLYRDYHDEYVTRIFPFTRKFATLQQSLNKIKADGGDDIPEAVYEGLYIAASQFPWSADVRIIFLLGDAPPHQKQRGSISQQATFQRILAKDILIHSMIFPH
ncbi:hypothetical protein PilKf_00738 [Pillotina sp. SPG140]